MPLDLKAFSDAASNIEVAEVVVTDLCDLAQWVIRDDILESVARRLNRPQLKAAPTISIANKQPGACLLSLVCTAGTASILRGGYLLPVHWRLENGGHDNRLPNRLRAVADDVLKVLGLNGYTLHLMLPEQKGPNQAFLADANDDMNSTFASLACGLTMLIKEVFPDFRTVCTGRYSNGLITRVAHVSEKTVAALEFPPRALEKRMVNWFVPSGDACDEATKTIESYDKSMATPTALTIRSFPEFRNFDQQLNALLASSGVCPDPQADFGVLQDYYQWLLALNVDQANAYYDEVLYEQILQRGFVDSSPRDARPTHFVTVVSSPALIGLAHRLFRFKHVLILFTVPAADGPLNRVDFSGRAHQARNLIQQADGILVKEFIYRPELTGQELWHDLETEMTEHIRSFVGGADPGLVMWDMTSGLRIFSHVLEKSFAREGDWMLAINQQWSSQQQNRIPCTETLVAWQHGRIFQR